MKDREHLKHLLFVDAVGTHNIGMNHNAGDRGCFYEGFCEHLTKENFDEIYEIYKERYCSARNSFELEPTYEIEDEFGNPVQCKGGYWPSLQELDKYVEYYLDRFLTFKVKCDSENNPPEIIEKNELHATISIMPYKWANDESYLAWQKANNEEI